MTVLEETTSGSEGRAQDKEPKFVKSPPNVIDVTEKEQMALECRAVGQEPLRYTWIKDGKLVKKTNVKPCQSARNALFSTQKFKNFLNFRGAAVTSHG
ncbi:MAG: immunoglobulin domain-containing protein [Cytophagales bacterium]|nr:immunoglobulin domain-containing protein [Cytophagales bacterium]